MSDEGPGAAAGEEVATDTGASSGTDQRLSEAGAAAAVAAVACPVLALLAWAGGESALAVGAALLAGAYAAVLVGRDVRRDRPPSPDDHLWLGGFCALAVVAAAVGRHWLTAAGLGFVALMQFGRWRGWKVEE